MKMELSAAPPPPLTPAHPRLGQRSTRHCEAARRKHEERLASGCGPLSRITLSVVFYFFSCLSASREEVAWGVMEEAGSVRASPAG